MNIRKKRDRLEKKRLPMQSNSINFTVPNVQKCHSQLVFSDVHYKPTMT